MTEASSNNLPEPIALATSQIHCCEQRHHGHHDKDSLFDSDDESCDDLSDLAAPIETKDASEGRYSTEKYATGRYPIEADLQKVIPPSKNIPACKNIILLYTNIRLSRFSKSSKK